MQTDMKDRLVELLKDTFHEWECEVQPETVLQIAEHLVENDVVPVVRCKDCKHWNNGDCYRIELTRPDDYCSYGERKL